MRGNPAVLPPVATLLALALLLLMGSTGASAAHAFEFGNGGFGGSGMQVPLTASYSTIGGGGSQVVDALTFVNNGVQQTVALTTTPTIYMVDSGTQWSAQTILNGSTSTERWITSQDVAGTIVAPFAVVFTYYHQYLVTFNFNVTNGGAGFSSPSVRFVQMGGIVSSPAPEVVWVDASSTYSYDSQLPGFSSTERWASQTVGTGTIASSSTVLVTYYHQYLVSSSYSIVGGGSPTPPSLSSTAFKAPVQFALTGSTQSSWFDAGAPYSWSPTLTGKSTETWVGTVILQMPSGNVLSTDNNGTVISALSITPAYHHQFLVSVDFAFVGGTPTGLTPPAFTYEYFGSPTAVTSNTVVWVDSGTQYTLPEAVCCTSSPGLERWELNNSTTGVISSATTISSTYFHQYMELFSYSFLGQPPPSPWTPPELSYLAAGSAQQVALLQTPLGVWADANSAYSVTSTISSSSQSERWFAQSSVGSIQSTQGSPIIVLYNQQYLITIVGGGLPTQWVNAGNNTTLMTPGVYGRSAGSGYRVVSYQIDYGAVVNITQPSDIVSIQLSINGPHTIAFQSVRQFQVSLDSGATGALSSITPPTVSGDNYWYDSESPIRVVLNGDWGRANGVGQRISTISATGQATIQVNGIGLVQAFATPSLQTPITITTTSATQYEVVLNKGAMAAFASISPPSTFPNDTFWYDAGSPAVTVVLDGVYSRVGGTGFRVSSWAVDSGPVTQVASTGTITIVTKAMTSAHFLNASTVTQYQITLDKPGSAALASMTNPSIPLDSGWYDASTPVGVIMNGAWSRSSGAGQRLAGFSLNGGPEVSVASTGLVTVLNSTKLSSSEAITTSTVTQYLVTLDGGATSALSSITSTPIPKDGYWFDSGTPVSVSLNGVWARTSTTGTRLTSYSVNLGASTTVLSLGHVQALSLPGISGPESISTKTVSQYRLTSTPIAWASLTNSTLPGDAAGWFDSGTAVKAVFNNVWGQNSTGSRDDVVSYTVDNGAKTSVTRSGTGTFAVALTMSASHTIAIASVTQYILGVVGPGQVTASPPSPTGDSYFDSGSKVTFTVPRVWNVTSSAGQRALLVSYSLNGGTPVAVAPSTSSASFTVPAVTFTGSQLLVLSALDQYQVTFQFFDAHGANPVTPSGVQIGVGNATVDVQGQSAWLANGTSFSLINVSWEGASVGPTPPPTYEVKAAPLKVTIETRVYPASLKAVDLFGLPVSGAQVSMTLANGTVLTGTTKGDGTFAVPMIPLGTFTAKVSSLGTSAQVVGSASSPAVAQAKVAFSLVSLIVVVAIVVGAGTAGVFLLRWSRSKKGSGGAVSEQK